jgi:hypothetical protein
MTNNPSRRRAFVVPAAVSLLGAAVLAGAPTASADEVIDLDNGLTVKITAPNPDLREIAVYPTPGEVHFRLPNEQQIDGTHLTHITRSQTPVRIQSCQDAVLIVSSNCRPWSTIDPFKYDAPEPPPPPGAPDMCSPGLCPAPPPPKQLPPPPPPPPAVVTDAISLSFGPPGLGSITATVSNSSDLNGKCTYDASPLNIHRDFNVPAHGSTDLTFTGLNTFTTYHAKVTCNDSSGKQKPPIGSDSKDVSF